MIRKCDTAKQRSCDSTAIRLERVVNLFILIVMFSLIISCGNSTVADTTSSSEVTNGMVITAVLADGSLVNGCRVSLIESDQWYNRTAEGKPVAVRAEITGEDGSVQFNRLDSGIYSVVIQSEKFGGRTVVTLRGTVSDTVVLSNLSTISGTVASFEGTPVSVAIAGTDIVVPCSPDGRFAIPAVPGDSSELVAIVANADRSVPVFGKGVVGTGSIDAGTIQVEPDAVLLDDFNDGDGLSIFGWFTGHGKWYAYDDSWLGGNSFILPGSALTRPETAISEVDSWQGKSMNLSFVMGNAISTPHASIACQLRENPDQYADLSGLRRLSCRIRGTGTVRINLISAAVDNFGPVAIRGDFGATVTLSDQWQELVIDMDAITPEPESAALKAGLRWSDVSDSVRSIVFGSWSNTPGDTVNLQLDDIILHGVDPAVYQKR